MNVIFNITLQRSSNSKLETINSFTSNSYPVPTVVN